MTTQHTSLDALRREIQGWKRQGLRIALVPTMGALHEGHMALVAAARAHADKVVVSIFVNPTQFGPNEDFDRYPRTLAQDMQLLEAHGADLVWTPDVAAMYAPDASTFVEVTGVSEGLCGAFRPGHFRGVATVVAKLLQQVQPDIALFGEKDYQQLCVIKRMVRDLDMPFAIAGVPTVREADGLALSSRNRYLTDEQRRAAPMLYAVLRKLAMALKSGVNEYSFSDAVSEIKRAGFSKVEYLELRRADSLQPLVAYEAGARLLVAAWLGKTRLIDNIEV